MLRYCLVHEKCLLKCEVFHTDAVGASSLKKTLLVLAGETDVDTLRDSSSACDA